MGQILRGVQQGTVMDIIDKAYTPPDLDLDDDLVLLRFWIAAWEQIKAWTFIVVVWSLIYGTIALLAGRP